MKKIIFLLIAFIMANSLTAQNKKLTLYYPDSTRVVNISGLDSMTIFICGASKVSYGGKDYNTVLIGNQCWLKENLDIGTMINGNQNPDPTPGGTIEKYCYNNNPNNCNTYGGLYSWEEAMQYVTIEGAQGICPDGWHIPKLDDFNELNTAVGGDGNSIKAVGQGSGSGAGTNTFAFSALLAGYRNPGGYFGELTLRTHFWSSKREAIVTSLANHIYLWDDRANISFHVGEYSTYGFSVRCIKNN
jgi:uncharacterized protein (TIGR02145 family)